MKDPFSSDLTPQPVAPRKLLEKDIENPCKTWARARGSYCRKFVSTANRSVPDDLMITRGWVWFAEFKKPGGKLTENQQEEHDAIRAAGGEVYVFDNVEDFKRKHREIEARVPRI
ncbi:MAG: VRR-NUC domain-containing protein [Steroidobacteraceae bacterium]